MQAVSEKIIYFFSEIQIKHTKLATSGSPYNEKTGKFQSSA
jgi:hypothetical protein